MSMHAWWRAFRSAPQASFTRLRQLTPSGIWHGVGLGALAVAAAGAGLCFHELTLLIEEQTLGRLAAAGSQVFIWGSLVCVLAGSALASALIAWLAPSASGGGVLPVKLAFWRDFGVLRFREAATKIVASAITLGTGTSLGPEGPSVQIGAATMSAAAGAAGVVKQGRRAWCAAGAAAGLAAVFNAPLAAIVFVLEEIIGDLNSRLIGSVVIAAVIGALASHAVLGAQPTFQTLPLDGLRWGAWALVPVVAALASASGALFQKSGLALRAGLRSWAPGSAWWPLLGAFITWAAGVCVYLACGRVGIFGIGYGDMTAAIAGQLTLGTAALLLAGKLVATAGAFGAGSCGGIFAPTLFIGAMAGAAVSAAAGLAYPISGGETAMLVMAGMAAGLGAVVRMPLTCVILLFEITNQWVIVPALMLAVIVSQGVSRLINRHDLYEETLKQNGLDPHQVLPPRHFKRWREIPVSALACFKPATTESLETGALGRLLAEQPHQFYPVVEATGETYGVLPRREIELAIAAPGHTPKLEKPQWISAKATVGEARKRMLQGGVDFLCVGDATDRRLIGVLTLHDLLRGESVLEDDAA
ncbi:MAG TPA: chloride channel protein [Opitutaceae bacterium]|nr:chloride channel protein [Opitutaceae bacterium]